LLFFSDLFLSFDLFSSASVICFFLFHLCREQRGAMMVAEKSGVGDGEEIEHGLVLGSTVARQLSSSC
jgi:hypothetical protein